MQQIDDLLQGVYDLLMTAYPESNENGPFPVLDNVLTSSQIIRMRLKAPGLLVMPCLSEEKLCLKREVGESDLQPVVKRTRVVTPYNSVVGKEATVEEVIDVQSAESSRTFPTQQPPVPALTRDMTPIEEYRLRPQFRKCALCNVMFTSNEQLGVHISTAHRNQQTWSCIAHTTCPMVFMDLRSMKTHVYELHIKECPVCKCRFDEPSLAKHIICTHAELTTCPICSAQFPEQHALMVHVKTQHDLPSYRLPTESTLSVKSESISP